MQRKSTITFCGGAGMVTGANFLFDIGGQKILIDCGLTQEGHGVHAKNIDFTYDPRDIDVLIVTHAHADHIGKIPKLVRDGFDGVIFSTKATRDLSAVMFDDALRILTEEADELGVAPLYAREDIVHTMRLWRGIDYHHPFVLGDGATARFLDAGHILGSAMV
ncbi:MAG: hypothetical protein CR954_00830, partial [Candidatus Moraniibacteriota bacterium]